MQIRSGVSRLLLSSLLVICAFHAAELRAQMAVIGAGFVGPPIDQIIVSGNAKTRERWILKWADITPGQKLTLSLLNKARQEIRDTDLFLDYGYDLEESAGKLYGGTSLPF